MIGADQLTAWVDAYVKAWNSNDPQDIEALFTEDAEYFTDPYSTPWTGRANIVMQWLEHRDKPGETTFDWQPLVVTGEECIVTGETRYPHQTYSNLWVIRLDADGRCSHFTEWWMEQPKKAD